MHNTMTPKTEARKWNSGILHFIIYTCAYPAVTWQNVSEGRGVKKDAESLFAHMPYKAQHSETFPLHLTIQREQLPGDTALDVSQCLAFTDWRINLVCMFWCVKKRHTVAKCVARTCQCIFWLFTVSSDNLLKRLVVFLWRISNDINKIPMHNALILRHSYGPCIWNDKHARQQNICWHLLTTACLSNSFSGLTCVIRFLSSVSTEQFGCLTSVSLLKFMLSL